MLRWRRLPLLLYGIVLVSVGLAIHLVGTVAFVLTDTIAPGLLAPVWPGRLLVVSGGLILAGDWPRRTGPARASCTRSASGTTS